MADLHALRSAGHRLTRQRLLILDLLRTSGQHLTADEIYAAVQQHARLNRATVYRTLQWLQDAGLIHKIDVGDQRLQYQYASPTAHHHLICRVCGAETVIDDHVIVGLSEHILHHYDFEAKVDHVAIFGRCGGCRVAAQAQPGIATE